MLFEPANRRGIKQKNHKINHEVSLSMEKVSRIAGGEFV